MCSHPELTGWLAGWWGEAAGKDWVRCLIGPCTLFSSLGSEGSSPSGLFLAMLPVELGPTVFLYLTPSL